MSPAQSKLQDLLVRMCANKETRQQMVEALEEEKIIAFDRANAAALNALYDDKWKADGFGYLGRLNYLDSLLTFVNNIK